MHYEVSVFFQISFLFFLTGVLLQRVCYFWTNSPKSLKLLRNPLPEKNHHLSIPSTPIFQTTRFAVSFRVSSFFQLPKFFQCWDYSSRFSIRVSNLDAVSNHFSMKMLNTENPGRLTAFEPTAITHKKKGKWSIHQNLQGIMCKMFIFRGVFKHPNIQKHPKNYRLKILKIDPHLYPYHIFDSTANHAPCR